MPACDLVAAIFLLRHGLNGSPIFVTARIEWQPIAISLLGGLAEVSSDAHAFLADFATSTEQVGQDRGEQVEDVVRPGAYDAGAWLAAVFKSFLLFLAFAYRYSVNFSLIFKGEIMAFFFQIPFGRF